MDIKNKIFTGDCRKVLGDFPADSVGVCITDPPYNYEFIGRDWNHEEIQRRVDRVKDSRTLVKNIPYGSGLAGGVRNKRWYERNRENILQYQAWCEEWGAPLFRACCPGALVAVFNSTRTVAHVQVALESVGFYARDCLVYRRASGIPKGLNVSAKLEKKGHPNAHQWDGWHSCLRNEWEAITVLQKPLDQNYTNTILKYGVGLFHAENGTGGFLSNIIERISTNGDQHVAGLHCTPKPLYLMRHLVELLVPDNPDVVVVDPFAGSGTTLLAAKQLGRTYVGIEMNQEYVELIDNRLSNAEPVASPTLSGGRSETLQLFG